MKDKSDWEDDLWQIDYAQALGEIPEPQKEKLHEKLHRVRDVVCKMIDNDALHRIGIVLLVGFGVAINFFMTKYISLHWWYEVPGFFGVAVQQDWKVFLFSLPMVIVNSNMFLAACIPLFLAVQLVVGLPYWICTGKSLMTIFD